MSIQIIYNEAKNEQFTFSSVKREKIRKNKAEHFIIKFHPNFFSSWYVYYTNKQEVAFDLGWKKKLGFTPQISQGRGPQKKS